MSGLRPPAAASPVPVGVAAPPQMAEPAELSPIDHSVVTAQLGRPPRGLRGIAHRCQCGLPDVVTTSPVLEDGTPFPTLYYLTCPRARAALGRLEAGGLMADMSRRIVSDPALAQAHQAAHRDYLAHRDRFARLPGDPGVGGMPDRVKCLHVLVAHELAVPGANPLGREALDAVAAWGSNGPCVGRPRAPTHRAPAPDRKPHRPRTVSPTGPGP